MLETVDGSAYIQYAALELRVHGLSHEADLLVAQYEELVGDQAAVDCLIMQTQASFLEYFTV